MTRNSMLLPLLRVGRITRPNAILVGLALATSYRRNKVSFVTFPFKGVHPLIVGLKRGLIRRFLLSRGECHGSDQVAAWLPKAATVNNLSSSALQAPHFVF
jgi:hypothetical protein